MKMPFRITDIVLSIALLAAMELPTPSFAETEHAAVSMSGLDLADPHDAERGLERIEQAANVSCGSDVWSMFGIVSQSTRNCRAAAVSDMVARSDAPMLTYAFEADYGAAPVARPTQMAMR